jgi:hypothetical protein
VQMLASDARFRCSLQMLASDARFRCSRAGNDGTAAQAKQPFVLLCYIIIHRRGIGQRAETGRDALPARAVAPSLSS